MAVENYKVTYDNGQVRYFQFDEDDADDTREMGGVKSVEREAPPRDVEEAADLDEDPEPGPQLQDSGGDISEQAEDTAQVQNPRAEDEAAKDAEAKAAEEAAEAERKQAEEAKNKRRGVGRNK